MKKKSLLFFLIPALILVGCGNQNSEDDPDPAPTPSNFDVEVTYKDLDKDVYVNKTLGGLLGQFAGFLSGYEFQSRTNPTGLPLEWFDFINGPYAGNYAHFTPGDTYRYCRLNVNPETGLSEVWSDDDFHIDILNQYILKELGYSSYAIKETWKKYVVSDWGGGIDAMSLINSKDMLAPFTGTIEAGNRYGWCTEAYIENETLGMNAPGMPNLATELIDTFGSNVGYFDSVIWGKFYAAMYSLAYFYDDVNVILEKALEVMPKDSYPYKTYQWAFEFFDQYPNSVNANNWKNAARAMHETRRNLYRIDNFQTDPNVNGGLAILSLLYGGGDYMETAKYSSMVGYDGDCTAAICLGFMGVLRGFKPTNAEYAKINEKLYHDGQGQYHNDNETTYQAKILSSEYPVTQKIDDIVDMYRQNFEMLLVQQGGSVSATSYHIPTTDLIKDHSVLFDNYDAEMRDTTGFKTKNGTLECLVEAENGNSHTGVGYFRLQNSGGSEAYHRYSLNKNKVYRLTAYVKTSSDGQISMFARDNKGNQEITFSNATSLIAKSFTFTATNSVMEVGFKFSSNSSTESWIVFDDFMLEEINYKSISKVSESNLNLYSNKYTKIVSRPAGYENKECYIRVQYRKYGGSVLNVMVKRNSKNFGGIIFSNTSANSLDGYAYVEIPYVFENNSDTIQLDFNGSKAYIGSIELVQKMQYMFR